MTTITETPERVDAPPRVAATTWWGFAALISAALLNILDSTVTTVAGDIATEAGRAALTEWARTAPDAPPVLKHPVVLRVWLGQLVGTEDLTRILDDHIAWAEEMMAEVADRERRATDADWVYPRVALRWSRRYFAAERDLARAMLEDLATLAAEARGTG